MKKFNYMLEIDILRNENEIKILFFFLNPNIAESGNMILTHL